VSEVVGGFVNVVAHLFDAEFLGDDVDLEGVFVDHVGEAEAVINDLGPAVAVEEFGRELGGGDVPVGRVGVHWVLVQGGQLLAWFNELLEAEQVAVDALSVGRGGDVFSVGGDCRAGGSDLVCGGGLWVFHGLAEGDRLFGDGAAGLCAAQLVLTGGGGLVGWAADAVVFVVGQLQEHLHVRVWGALELLDEALAVALVGEDGELVFADDGVEVADGGVDGVEDALVDLEADFLWGGQGACDGRVELDLVVEDDVVDVVVEAVGLGAVHHGVLAHEARRAVLVDDELQRLVVEAVLTVAVPVLVGALLAGDWGLLVEADDEGRGLDLAEQVGVSGGHELVAEDGPLVAVLRGQRADGGGLDVAGGVDDGLELGLELAGGDSAAVDLVRDLVEAVLADRDDVLVLAVLVRDRLVHAVLDGHSAHVEHPLVRVHAHRVLLHVLGLECLGVHHVLEGQCRRGQRSRARRLGLAQLVVLVRVEVRDVGDDRVADREIRALVPPVVDPVLDVGAGGVLLQLLLELHALLLDKLLHSRLGVGILLRRGNSLDALQIAHRSLLQRGHRKLGQTVLEAQHRALGLVLHIPVGRGLGRVQTNHNRRPSSQLSRSCVRHSSGS
jgi:hypothetical protein